MSDLEVFNPSADAINYARFAPPTVKPAAAKAETSVPAQDWTAKQLELSDKQAAAEDETIKSIRQADAEYQRLARQHTKAPPDPKLQNIAPPKPLNFTDPIKAFQNPGVIIATLGSLFSRAPMTAALNAGGAAMEAYHKGEAEVFAQKKEEWKEATEAAIKQNEVELQRYNAAWKRADMAINDKKTEMQAIAMGMKDEIIIAGLNSNRFERVEKILETRQKAVDQMQQALLKEELQDRHSLMTAPPDRQAMNKFMAEHPDATAEDMRKFLQGMKGGVNAIPLQRYLDEHPDATPEQIQAFQQSGRYGRSAIAMYMNRYLQEHPDASSDDVKRAAQTYTTQTTAQNRFLSGPQGNTVRSLNVVVSHLQTMQGLSDALQNSDIPAFNRLAQRWAEETGQPAPTNFDTAKQIVGTEIIKALGVMGAGTEAERREAADSFNRARSPEQISGSIKVAQQLLGGQLQGLKRQFVASTGLPADRFDEMLEPNTREFLGGRTGKPTMQEWLPAARQANPGVSDDELTAAYKHKYGG